MESFTDSYIVSIRLKKERTLNNLSIEALSQFINIPYEVILDYETQSRIIDIYEIVHFARFYNISIDYLLGFSDHRKPLINTVKLYY